jgi:hypothetical protein
MIDPIRSLLQAIDRIDTAPLGHAIGRNAVDHPLLALALLVALTLLVVWATRRELNRSAWRSGSAAPRR